MARTGPIRAVVFDFGGVLTGPMVGGFDAWLAADRIQPDSFYQAIRKWMSRSADDGTPVHQLETGAMSVAEFEVALAAELVRVDGSPVTSDGLLARVFRQIRVEATMIDLVRELRTHGLRTGLLSNSWGDIYPRGLIEELFHDAVISGEVGLRKPDPRIYRMILERIGIPPEESVFIDDARPNVDAAEALGMAAILHTDPGATRAALAELVPRMQTGPSAQEL